MSYDTYNTNTYTAAIAHAVRVMNDHQRDGKARVAAERAYTRAVSRWDSATKYARAVVEARLIYDAAVAAAAATSAAESKARETVSQTELNFRAAHRNNLTAKAVLAGAANQAAFATAEASLARETYTATQTALAAAEAAWNVERWPA